MSIIKIEEITPKNIRAVIPPKYKGKAYKKLVEGDKVTIVSVVFSIYNARKDGEFIVTKQGENITNTTVYLGLSDGHYTSLKNDIVLGQMAALTGFDETAVGYYEYDVPPENVTVVTTEAKMGKKTYPVLAFKGE